MHGKLITQHLLRYAHQSLDSASERIHVYAHQRWYTTVDACQIQTGLKLGKCSYPQYPLGHTHSPPNLVHTPSFAILPAIWTSYKY